MGLSSTHGNNGKPTYHRASSPVDLETWRDSFLNQASGNKQVRFTFINSNKLFYSIRCVLISHHDISENTFLYGLCDVMCLEFE